MQERLVSLLWPRRPSHIERASVGSDEAHDRQRTHAQKMPTMLVAGEFDDRRVEITVEQKASPVVVGGIGMEHMDMDLQGMLEKIVPKQAPRRPMTVVEAGKVLFEQEVDGVLDAEKINAAAIELAENVGIIFLDEIDKVVASESQGADVSRQGVQRDLLPIVEGTTVQTRYGYVRPTTSCSSPPAHSTVPSPAILSRAAGPFPIRVELKDLTKDDFIRILTEPKNSLTRQYAAFLETEGVSLEFTADAVE